MGTVYCLQRAGAWGADWGVLCLCIGSVQGVPSFQERDGGVPPLHTFVFVQDFPLLRPAYVGTCVGHMWYT